ncbi:MAG: hypothetical protein AMJ64_02550 [Betaproteobacteria bacterium SG8_39]|nr:MAG: hypothetical protein AMJ64_02550 [Betaproteobacteria bacterium SG8_39]
MASPCVNVCVMDEARGLCRGCYRTLDEIARWSVMHDADKRAVIALLEARKGATPGSDPCG